MAGYVGVRASEQSWDDHGDAQTEMSVAPVRPRGGVEANSGRGPAPQFGPTGGYSADELASLAAQDDDDGENSIMPDTLALVQVVQVLS